MRKFGWIVGLILIIAALGLLVLRSMDKRAAERKAEAEAAAAHALPVQTARVELGNIEATIETSGTIAVREEADIVAKIPGRVASVAVDEGDTVRAGQVVIRLEQDDILAQLDQAKAAVGAAEAQLLQARTGVQAAEAQRGAARAQLTAIRTGARTQERKQAEAAVAQARANLENARSTYERMKKLCDAGGISKQQMDLVQMQYDVAKAQYDSAQEQLSLVREGARKEDIEAAEQRLRQAEAGVAQAKSAVKAAEAGLMQAKAALQFAEVQLANTFIRSPISGRVSLRQTEPGEMAPGASMMRGVPLLHVVNNQTAYVEVSIPDVQMDEVKRGGTAKITIDGIPGRAFRGRVTELNPASDPASRSCRVKASLENPSPDVKPGMFARVSLVVHQRQGVVVLPRHVVMEKGRNFVMVKDGNVAREREVTLGLVNQEQVEVTSGLRPGEEVVVVGQELLKDGDPIEVTKQGGRS